MRVRKAVLAAGLLVASFVLAARPAKADNIIFIENPDDTITVNSTSCGLETAPCTATATAPTGLVFKSVTKPSGSSWNNTGTLWSFGITEPTNPNNLSDALVFANAFAGGTLFFVSDNPSSVGDPFLAACGGVVDGINVPCDLAENGSQQPAGTINWGPATGSTITATTNIFFTSDLDVSAVPEPASLILLGSGIALVGFVRRRRVATP